MKRAYAFPSSILDLEAVEKEVFLAHNQQVLGKAGASCPRCGTRHAREQPIKNQDHNDVQKGFSFWRLIATRT